MKVKIITAILAVLLVVGVAPAQTLAANSEPFTLEAPQNLSVELKYDQNNWPYFALKMDVPQSVQQINKNLNTDSQFYTGANCSPIKIRFEFKYGKYNWNQGPSLYDITEMSLDDLLGGETFSYYPYEEENALGGIDIKSETYNFRATFYSSWGYVNSFVDKEIKSGYSNTVTLGNPAHSSSNRLSGANRFETAVSIAKEGWPNGAKVVILARDDNYPDALTGAPLSKKLDAPILFTNSKTLTPATESEISRLKAQKIIILGGTGAVSSNIENKLKQTYEVKRIGGTDRYETAEQIAKELGYKGKVVITTGMDFHDALTVSPLAAYKNIPILLTKKDALPQATKDALSFIAPKEITVVGNTNAVSEKVVSALSNAKRVSGITIYQSSVAVAKSFGADTEKMFLATGKDFPDALAASGLAAKYNSPILFVDQSLSDVVRQYLIENKDKTNQVIYLLGGEGAIPQKVQDEVNEIFK